ncbi:hypothetical protein D3C76_1010450 [compost metagenome]
MAVAHRADHVLGAALQLFDHQAGFFDRLLGAARQVAHFVGHHGKAAPGFTGTGGFDGGIEGQQVGLFGNRGNHFGGQGNILGLAGQMGYRLIDLADGTGQQLDRLAHAARHRTALPGQLIGRVRFTGGFLHMARDLGNRGRHLGHRGGGHVGFRALFKQGRFGVARQAAGVSGRLTHLHRKVAQTCQGGFQPRLFADQDHLQLRRWPQGIAVSQRHDRVGKGVARTLNDLRQLTSQTLMSPQTDHAEQPEGNAVAEPAW